VDCPTEIANCWSQANARVSDRRHQLDDAFIKTGAAPSFLWFAAIQGIKRLDDLASLAPGGSFIATDSIERVIGQIAEPQETTREFKIGSNQALG
jgi:hypothetical protein